MDSGYFALFLQTGEPVFYTASKQEENGAGTGKKERGEGGASAQQTHSASGIG